MMLLEYTIAYYFGLGLIANTTDISWSYRYNLVPFWSWNVIDTWLYFWLEMCDHSGWLATYWVAAPKLLEIGTWQSKSDGIL